MRIFVSMLSSRSLILDMAPTDTMTALLERLCRHLERLAEANRLPWEPVREYYTNQILLSRDDENLSIGDGTSTLADFGLQEGAELFMIVQPATPP